MRRLALISCALLSCLLGGGSAQAYVSGPARAGDPLSGHRWYVDRHYGTWWAQIHARRAAAALRRAANNPMGKSFGSYEPHPEVGVRNYLARAAKEEPGAIPFIALSRIEHQSCPYVNPGPAFSEAAVEGWARRFSDAIGHSRVMVLVEADKLAVMGCLPPPVQAQRYREITDEIHTMHVRNPNAIVYLDAGASDWVPARHMAAELRQADVAEAQGFALGASHFDWTYREAAYGLTISRALGGKHFVINTSANGRGPRSRWRSSDYHRGCTPTGEGLGYRPTIRTSHPSVIDAYLWLSTPGYESGSCLGKRTGYGFYLAQALSLIRYANPRL